MPYMTQQEIGMLTSMPKTSDIGSALIIGSNISQAVQVIGNLLFQKAIADELDVFHPVVRSYVGKNINLAYTLSNGKIGDVANAIEDILHADYFNYKELMKKGVWWQAGGMFASLYENTTGLSALTNAYNGIIQTHGINPFITRWVNSQIAPNIPDMPTAYTMRLIGNLSDLDYRNIVLQNGWNLSYIPNLEASMNQTIPMGMILELIRRGSVTTDVARQMLNYYKIRGTHADKFLEMVKVMPEPYRIADMTAKGLSTTDEMHEAFRWYGIENSWADKFTASSYNIPAMSILTELLWRGEIDIATFNIMIAKQAVHPDIREKLVKLTESIPPSSDIITMVVREAFEASNIVTAPTDFSSWMLKKGYSNYWSDKYWTAHFLPMALTQGYDNLRRGYWDEAKFKDLLRIADIHPRWHDDIVKVAWNPPTTRELGYGFDVGVYSREDLIKYRRWGGLSLEDATKAADSLIDYRLDAERNSLRSLWMNQYVNGAIEEKDLRGKLKDLKTNAGAIELWVDRGNLLIDAKKYESSLTEPKNLTRSDIQYMFEQGLKVEKWFTETLEGLGYAEDIVKIYLEQSKFKIELAKAKLNTPTEKHLSVAEITNLYYNKIIPVEELTAGLVRLGYNSIDAQKLTNLIILETPQTFKQLTIAQLTTMLHKGEITREEMLARLKAMKYSIEDAEALTKLIEQTKVAQSSVPKITMGDLEQLYKYAYFDEKELIAEYEKRGYSHQDAVLKGYLSMLDVKLPMLVSKYRNAWIGEADLYNEIMDISIPFEVTGIPQKRIDDIMMTIVKNNKAERTYKERDLTKAEIIKGAKNNVFTTAQAVELLQNLGYSETEANYLLAINKIIAINDPKGYWDMKQATELYKKSQGLPSVDVPDELITLEEQWKKKRTELKSAKEHPEDAVKVGSVAVEVANIEAQIATIKSRMKIK